MTAVVDFTLRTGERFWWDVSAKQPDGTFLAWDGYSASLQLRQQLSDASPVFEASTSNGRVTAAGSALTIDISGVLTAAIDPGVYHYDMKVWALVDVSDAEFVLAGSFRVLEAATR